MALKNQIHVYSIDTSSFFNQKERRLYKKITKLGREKKEIVKKIYNIDYQLFSYGLNNTEVKNCAKESFIIDFSKYEDYEITHIKYLVLCKSYYVSIRDTQSEWIGETKEFLLKGFQERELRADELESNSSKYKLIRHLNRNTLSDNKVVSIFESALTRILCLEKDELTDSIIIVKVYYFEVIKDLIKNGFIHNGEKYKFFTASAGQIRTKKTVFIKQSLWDTYEKVLMCGLSIDSINEKGGINVNKYLAYLALSNSATDLWDDFNIDKSIVVEDFETLVRGEVDLINDNDYSINRVTMDVPITHTDGCGMILPEFSRKNFMVRLPWVKGLLAVFDYRKFISEKQAVPIIKDIYGSEHDIIAEDIQIIFTKSQFKMYKYYDNWQQYKDFYKKHGCSAGKCNVEEDKIATAKINYQMMQTLTDMNQKELSNIASFSNKKINELSTTVKSMLSAFGVSNANTNKSSFQQALEIYPELLQDVYTKEVIRKIKKSMIKYYKSAKLDIRGKYTFIVPDLYAFCERLFLDDSCPEGLLKNNEVYCRLYPKSKKLDCLRSPHLYKEHAVRNNIIDENSSKWFVTDAIYTSTYDLISKMLQFDVDGDKGLIVADRTYIDIAKRNMKDIVPLYYNMRKADAVMLNNNQIYRGLKSAYTGGNIGGISNDITKIWNSDIWNKGSEEEKNEALQVIKLLCMENNFVIDYAKTLYKPTRPDEINTLIRKYTKSKVPHFFIYAKDKSVEQVEKKNNSLVNSLDDIIKDRRLSFKLSEFGKLDYKILMSNPNIIINKIIIELYIKLNRQYHYKINMEDERDTNISYIAKNIRDELSKTGCTDSQITDILIKYLFFKKQSKSKEALWFCYGDIIVKNIKKNIDKKTSMCMKCGGRFEKNTPNQHHCLYCLNEIIVNKEIKCIDCGATVQINSKNTESKRCLLCYGKYRREYKRQYMQNTRNIVDSANEV